MPEILLGGPHFRSVQKAQTCSRRSGSHKDGHCTTQTAKCINLHVAYGAKSKGCSCLKKTAMYWGMCPVTALVDRREANDALRFRYFRRRHPAAPRSLPPPSLPSPLVEPSQVGPLALTEEQHYLQARKTSNNCNSGHCTLWFSLPSPASKVPEPAGIRTSRSRLNRCMTQMTNRG